MEEHHPLTRKADPAFTITTPVNLHRALSDDQRDHPPIIDRQNPLELFRELVLFLIEAFRRSANWLEEHLADLEELNAFDAERLGSAWPEDFRQWQQTRREAGQ